MAIAARALRAVRAANREAHRDPDSIGFPALLQEFFHRRLLAERGVSAHTIASYRDTFELLLRYAERQTGQTALGADARRPRRAARARLPRPPRARARQHAAHAQPPPDRDPLVHALRLAPRPHRLPVAERVLAIPRNASTGRHSDFLTRAEVDALLDAPDQQAGAATATPSCSPSSTTPGPRLRARPPCASPTCSSTATSAVHLHGKGRKERVCPLEDHRRPLRAWLARIDQSPDAPVFPNRAGKPMTRSGDRAPPPRVAIAAERCPSLAARHLAAHVSATPTAMHLLQSGVDITVIALWLGHETSRRPTSTSKPTSP